MKRFLVCFGTRPEYIKVKSLIDNLPYIKTLFTGQHVDLIKHVVDDLQINYKIVINDQTDNRLNDIICSILKHNYIFKNIDYVIVQGDTASAFAVALAAFNCQKKVIHLEAGLRTHNIHDPYPEELNRQLISRIANIHLCPTEQNKQNLINEQIHLQSDIYVVGNTGLDNLNTNNCNYTNKVLITMHRRDNVELIEEWFKCFEQIAIKYSDLEFILPLHPNPDIRKHAHLLKHVHTIEPLKHEKMIFLLKQTRFVISDSGGLQEEASFFKKKIIVCRKTTERPETLNITSIMCKEPNQLSNIVDKMYNDYIVDSNTICPYGDGAAWKKIDLILKSII